MKNSFSERHEEHDAELANPAHNSLSLTIPTLGYLGWTKQNVVELANYAINRCFNMSLGEILKLHNKILSIWRFRIFLVHARNFGVLRDPILLGLDLFERGVPKKRCVI